MAKREIWRSGFTMIELVFVIVVVGILSAIAIPKFAATRDDAIITKARTTVGALRSAISMERQKRILEGNFTNVTLSEAVGLLDYGLDKRWSTSGNTLKFTAPNGHSCSFVLQNNKLDRNATNCNVAGLDTL
ncbi:type II secretion system protein [Nitratifractor sp.]|uniref:type II secretion system protein n=1 Tax=Nitratifractor sp. TaxID=2268144 RepID=UPI0025E98DF4|nr:type II secretion system protein [Nitratifractor sp.]